MKREFFNDVDNYISRVCDNYVGRVCDNYIGRMCDINRYANTPFLDENASLTSPSDGDVTDGGVTGGDVTGGDVTGGDVTGGDVTDGDINDACRKGLFQYSNIAQIIWEFVYVDSRAPEN